MGQHSSDTALAVARKITRDFDAVVHPDHPLLVDPPNILVATPNNLVALFIASKNDIKNPDRLLFRLSMTRLVLHSEVRCALILSGDVNDYSGDAFVRHFHEIVRADQSRMLRNFLRDKAAIGQVHPVDHQFRKKTFRRYHILMQENKLYDEQLLPSRYSTRSSLYITEQINKKVELVSGRKVKHNNSHDLFDMLVSERKLRSVDNVHPSQHGWASEQLPSGDYQVVANDDLVLGLLGEGKNRSAMALLRPICRALIELSFSLDNGSLYPIRDTVNMLLARRIPLWRTDPEKPIRVAAFCGWATIPYAFGDNVFEYGEELDKKIHRRKG